jgi:hypothetical protein
MWRLRQTQAVGALHGTSHRGCSGHPCGDREQGDYVWFIQGKAAHWRWHEHPDMGSVRMALVCRPPVQAAVQSTAPRRRRLVTQWGDQ